MIPNAARSIFLISKLMHSVDQLETPPVVWDAGRPDTQRWSWRGDDFADFVVGNEGIVAELPRVWLRHRHTLEGPPRGQAGSDVTRRAADPQEYSIDLDVDATNAGTCK